MPGPDDYVTVQTPRGPMRSPATDAELGFSFKPRGPMPPAGAAPAPTAPLAKTRVEIEGHVVEFDGMPTPEDIDAVAQQSGIQRTATTTTPTTTPSAFASMANQLPTLVGAARGGATGFEMGGLPGMVLGAGLGGGLGDLALTGAQRLVQKVTGSPVGANVNRSMLPAIGTGIAAEAGGRALGNVAKGLTAAKPVAEAVEDPLTAAMREQASKLGSGLDKTSFAKAIRGPLRAALRQTEREFKTGNAAQKQAIQPMLNDLRRLTHRTISLAPLADAFAKDPVLIGNLLREHAPELLPELQSSWLTAASHLSPEEALKAFRDLGDEGQRVLFSTRAPVFRKLFETSALTSPALQGSAKQKGMAPAFKVAWTLLKDHALRMLPGGRMLSPLYMFGKLLRTEGGPEWLTTVAETATNPRVWVAAAPQLGRIGGALLAKPVEEQAVGMMSPMAATAAP